MASRAIASGTISFGLVSIPAKLYTAAHSEQVSFNMIHKKCGGRVKQQYICPTDANEVVERSDMTKGFEHAKSYYLGADKGGDKAYRLLSRAMDDKERVAVGRWAARGKEQLVLVRPYEDGLILHQLFYANEVRAFSEIDGPAKLSFTEKERDLALKLIDQLTSEAFEAEKYHDTYSDKVREAVEQKVAGQEITIAPEAPRAQIIDLFDALKKTLAEGPKPPPSVLKGGPKKAEAKDDEDEEESPKKKRAKG